MAAPEFILPSWLNDQDAETVHKRMMEKLPPDIDDTEGGFPWDFTKPTALEKAELLEFFLPETLKIMFPMWAYGYWLDLHAKAAGTKRKAANPAYGKLEITGTPGTEIPAGFRFAVASTGLQAVGQRGRRRRGRLRHSRMEQRRAEQRQGRHFGRQRRTGQ